MTISPETFMLGATQVNTAELTRYLEHTDQLEFLEMWNEALEEGLSSGEALCSFYAKLCYAALTTDKNLNISRVRGIPDNIKNCFDMGHGSVFQHCWINFVTTDCSRVFTHELVRHGVGTALSQTSGRYVRVDKLRIVDGDPLLDDVRDLLTAAVQSSESWYRRLVIKSGVENMKDFNKKKKLTSALRRILPQGICNEIGWSCNIRSLRHMLMMRTNRHAEWEIRYVFDAVYRIINTKFPLMLHGHKAEVVDGLLEITGMKLQPY